MSKFREYLSEAKVADASKEGKIAVGLAKNFEKEMTKKEKEIKNDIIKMFKKLTKGKTVQYTPGSGTNITTGEVVYIDVTYDERRGFEFHISILEDGEGEAWDVSFKLNDPKMFKQLKIV